MSEEIGTSNRYVITHCHVCGLPRESPYVILSEPTCSCGKPDDPPAPQADALDLWRVGGKVPLNVYEDDKPMFQCHTPEDAARVVALLNQARELESLRDQLARSYRERDATVSEMHKELESLRAKVAELPSLKNAEERDACELCKGFRGGVPE